MIFHVPVQRIAVGCVVVLSFLFMTLAGCASDDTGTTTTGAGGSPTNSSSEGTTSTSSLMSEWDKQIKEVVAVQHELTQVLLDEDATDNDPRMAIAYGLRACTQAIACRQALDKADLELADTAMLEVYYSLNLARTVATGTVAETVAGARAIVETLGSPSAAPEQAATLLEQFIAALAPLVDEARAVIPATTTTAT